MNKLSWCFKQNSGVKLVDPSENLAKSYLDQADGSLKVMTAIENIDNNWFVVTAYYSCYNAFYALLQKCGIKSEIHDCTIELFRLFVDLGYFDIEHYNLFNDLKQKRINVQYYNKLVDLPKVNEVKSFVLIIKKVMHNFSDVENVRDVLMKRGGRV